MNETNSFLILILVTVVLAVYTFLGIRWWLGQKERISVLNQWIQIGLSLLIVAIVIIAPLVFLAYLMNDIRLVKNITPNERGFVLFAWCIPASTYVIIYLIRKSKSEKK
jgi:hypothetical protein